MLYIQDTQYECVHVSMYVSSVSQLRSVAVSPVERSNPFLSELMHEFQSMNYIESI